MTAAARRISEPEENLAGMIRMLRLPEPERQFCFAAGIGRKWAADFAWPEYSLIVECDGGVYSRGRHVRGKGYEADCTKLNHAVLLGWRVLRVTPSMIDSGEAVRLIEQALMR